MTEPADRPKGRSIRPLRALLPFLRPYRTTLLLALGALLVAAAAMLALPVAARFLIDRGFAASDADTINRYFGWFLLAAGVVRPRLGLVLLIELVMGFAYAQVNMNNTRLAMVLVPEMGRSHFFALYSVTANLTLGLAPILWGLVIDAFGNHAVRWQGIELNRFSFFFLAVLGVFAVTLVLCRRLDEPKARDIDELLREILQSPQRLWLRLWPRG